MAANELMDLEDKARLELTQSTRERIVREMLKDGKIPEGEENRAFLLKAMDGMDRVVLAKAKIKVDDSAAKANAAGAAMVAELLRGVHSNPRQLPRTEVLELPAMEITTVEGETHIGVQTFTLDQIMTPKNPTS
jgi:hypothetical protein